MNISIMWVEGPCQITLAIQDGSGDLHLISNLDLSSIMDHGDHDQLYEEEEEKEEEETINYEDEEALLMKDASTQKYDKYGLGAHLDNMIIRIELVVGNCKYFLGLNVEPFYALFEFLGESNYGITYWGWKGGNHQIQQFLNNLFEPIFVKNVSNFQPHFRQIR